MPDIDVRSKQHPQFTPKILVKWDPAIPNLEEICSQFSFHLTLTYYPSAKVVNLLVLSFGWSQGQISYRFPKTYKHSLLANASVPAKGWEGSTILYLCRGL